MSKFEITNGDLIVQSQENFEIEFSSVLGGAYCFYSPKVYTINYVFC